MSRPSRREQRRSLRHASRRRRRGGSNRAPIAVQRAARHVEGRAVVARDVGERLLGGDRPLALALVGVLVLAVVMLSGPLQAYLDGRERVEVLEQQVAALSETNTDLGRRAEALQDPETIELMAREQQGLIRPGEVPYAIVPPEVDRPRIRDARGEPTAPTAWYERAWGALRDLVGA